VALPKIAVTDGSFHGRTLATLTATGNRKIQAGFEPLVEGFVRVPYGDAGAIAAIAAGEPDLVAVLVEPVQGEGGAVPATHKFMAALRARATAVGAALILDEVQCGMGRCGRLLASEHYGVRGDLVVLSKALGGGLPLGAVLMTAGVADALAPGMHGSTFGGGAAVTAAGAFVLERVRRPSFLARVRKHGRALADGLAACVARHPSLAATRGLGLLQAVEIARDAPYDPPALVAAARAEGLLLVRGGERAVRFLPPLIVTPQEIATALERFDAAVARLESKGESR
jgi:acetylornithine aminotransferase